MAQDIANQQPEKKEETPNDDVFDTVICTRCKKPIPYNPHKPGSKRTKCPECGAWQNLPHTINAPKEYWDQLRSTDNPNVHKDEQEQKNQQRLQDIQKSKQQPQTSKRPLTEWENSIRTKDRMDLDWKRYENVVKSTAAYGAIASFYEDWKDAPPPPGRYKQPIYTIHYLFTRIMGAKSPTAAIAFAKFINDHHIPHDDDDIVLLGYTANIPPSKVNKIKFLLAAPPVGELFQGGNIGWDIQEYLRVLDQSKFDDVVKILHKYENVDQGCKRTIYQAIASSYIASNDDSWDQLLANSNLDLSQLASRVYQRFEQGSDSYKCAHFLNTFIDRISSKVVKDLFYSTIDNDKETGEYIFSEFFPKKPDIDRVQIIIDGMATDGRADEGGDGINHYTLTDLTQLLNAHEMKRLEEAYLKGSTGYSSTLVGMLKNPHSDQKALYDFINKLGYKDARNVLVNFQTDSSTEEEKKRLNVPVIQKIIERSPDREDIVSLIRAAEDYKNINFPSAKKRYNEITTKQNAANPKTLENAKNRILKYFEHEAIGDEFLTDWVNICYEKKDWFYLDNDLLLGFIYNQPMQMYIKYKPNAASSIYHDIKANYDNVIAMRDAASSIKSYGSEMRRMLSDPSFSNKLVSKAQNFSQYVKLAERLADALSMMHNSDISDDIGRKLIFNTSVNLKDKTIEEFVEIMGEVDKLASEAAHNNDLTMGGYLSRKIDEIHQVNANIINKEAFLHNLGVFDRLEETFNNGEAIKFTRGSPEYIAVKQLHTQLEIIKQFETIKEYIADAKPKDKRMFELNWVHPSGLKFEVMGYLDPAAFSVGAETECCQRIGGAGVEAAIDSFVNSMASVLTVSYNGKLISQSYFHITNVAPMAGTPAVKIGIILDNVEHNEKNERDVGLNTNSLTKAYADWAAAMKAKNENIAYILCGKDYSKINNSMFGAGPKMKEDPREFSVDEPYSDFDENDNLDLLKPSKGLEAVNVSLRTTKQAMIAEKQTLTITKAMVRRMAMDELDLFASIG
jgi:hypothetical protein